MLVVGRACYSYKAVRECREKVYWTATTVRVKAQHYSKCYEIQRLFDECCEKTGCTLFDCEYSVWKEYSKLVNSMDSTKKDMDRALKACCRYLLNELELILKDMDNGDVDSVA